MAVSGLTGIKDIAGGYHVGYALRGDGTVWAWGYGSALGDGTTATQRNKPVQVQGLSGVVAIGAGPNHSLAIKSDGSVLAWGWMGEGSIEASGYEVHPESHKS